MYTPENVAELDDGWLAAHYFDTLFDCGEDDEGSRLLKAEIDRRGLTDAQLDAAYRDHQRRINSARPQDFTEEEVEAAMADCYTCLPITDHASLAAAVNKVIESRYGPAED